MKVTIIPVVIDALGVKGLWQGLEELEIRRPLDSASVKKKSQKSKIIGQHILN